MNIYEFSKQQLADKLIANHFKAYNATQIFEWLYVHKVRNFNQMTNLKKELIIFLSDNFDLSWPTVLTTQSDTDVDKFLIKYDDGQTVEAVLMKHNYGYSVCLSSQVGCNMGCQFCASGKIKKIRNLTAGEMVTPILLIEDIKKLRISHVVVMGIGEPLDNFTELVKFLYTINDPKGLAIGARHITVSTSGLVPAINEFAELPLQVNLAISLHAANDQLRSELMPINKVYPLVDLIKAVKNYIRLTNRRITFEYILLDGINDRTEDARELANLIRGINAYVNLIPYNSTNSSFRRSELKNTLNFYDYLKKMKINATIRREFGSNIDAACGQLRVRSEECK